MWTNASMAVHTSVSPVTHGAGATWIGATTTTGPRFQLRPERSGFSAIADLITLRGSIASRRKGPCGQRAGPVPGSAGSSGVGGIWARWRVQAGLSPTMGSFRAHRPTQKPSRPITSLAVPRTRAGDGSGQPCRPWRRPGVRSRTCTSSALPSSLLRPGSIKAPCFIEVSRSGLGLRPNPRRFP